MEWWISTKGYKDICLATDDWEVSERLLIAGLVQWWWFSGMWHESKTRPSSDISAQKSQDFVHAVVVTVEMEDKSAEAISHCSSALMATPGWWRRDAPAASGQDFDCLSQQGRQEAWDATTSSLTHTRNFLNVPHYCWLRRIVFWLMFLQVTDGRMMESLLVEVFRLPVEVEVEGKVKV